MHQKVANKLMANNFNVHDLLSNYDNNFGLMKIQVILDLFLALSICSIWCVHCMKDER